MGTVIRYLSLLLVLSTILIFAPSADKSNQGLATLTPSPYPAGEGKIAFISDRDGNEQIYIMDNDGSNQRRLTNFKGQHLEGLTWSPDLKYLAFVMNSQIYTINVDRLTMQRLTTTAINYAPAWSPNGKYIAYISTRGGPYDIWVMDTNGVNIVQVTNDPPWELCVKWSPDGKSIGYVQNMGADLQIWVTSWLDSASTGTFLIERAAGPE